MKKSQYVLWAGAGKYGNKNKTLVEICTHLGCYAA